MLDVPSKLNNWVKTNLLDRKCQTSLLNSRLDELNVVVLDEENLAELTKIKIRLTLEADNKLFWEQRERMNWLCFGVRNTSYFHSFASS